MRIERTEINKFPALFADGHFANASRLVASNVEFPKTAERNAYLAGEMITHNVVVNDADSCQRWRHVVHVPRVEAAVSNGVCLARTRRQRIVVIQVSSIWKSVKHLKVVAESEIRTSFHDDSNRTVDTTVSDGCRHRSPEDTFSDAFLRGSCVDVPGTASAYTVAHLTMVVVWGRVCRVRWQGHVQRLLVIGLVVDGWNYFGNNYLVITYKFLRDKRISSKSSTSIGLICLWKSVSKSLKNVYCRIRLAYCDSSDTCNFHLQRHTFFHSYTGQFQTNLVPFLFN